MRIADRKLRALALRGFVVLCAVVAVVAIGSATMSSWAGPDDDHKHDHAHDHGDRDEAKMMEQYQAAGKTGEHHELLKVFVGNWNAESKFWMGPGEPTTAKAESKQELIMDGRFVRQTYKSQFEMPGPDGKMTKQEFHGEGLTGYDNLKKEFVSSWVDNMSTSLYTEHGQYNKETREFVMLGSALEPGSDVPVKSKSVIRIVSNDKHVFEMFKERGPGNWNKEMEITYTRK